MQSAFLACLMLVLPACAATSIRSQSPEEIAQSAIEARLVGEVAVPDGMRPVAVEAIALVTGLAGSGSDPQPSPERTALLDEMQKRGVINPNQVMASSGTSLVFVRGYLRPGVQKGDRFDVEVRIPSRSETTSLRDGWLMESRLREMAAIANSVHQGHVLALAKGPILIDPAAELNGDKTGPGRGRILGGGVALKSRPLRLVLKPDHRSVRNSAMIGTALNRRFSTFQQGIKHGVATPKTDEYVELILHPRYKDNISRTCRFYARLRSRNAGRAVGATQVVGTPVARSDNRGYGSSEAGSNRETRSRYSGKGDSFERSASAVLCRRGAGLSRRQPRCRAAG